MSIPINPVLNRELTERMRGPRAMVMITIYLVILSMILVLVYRAQTTVGQYDFDGVTSITEIAGVGQGLFEWTLFFALLLVLFLVPGFTAGAIAGERERQTLQTMQITLLKPSAIVFGKLAASVAFTLLLVVATLPLLTVAYLIGGVRLTDIFAGLGMVVFIALALAALTLACSTMMKRVQTATVLAYGLVLFLVGGTLALYAVAGQIDSSRGFDPADPPELIVVANPLVALANLSGDDNTYNEFFGYYGGANGPLSALKDLIAVEQFSQFGQVVSDGPVVPAQGPFFEGDVFGGDERFVSSSRVDRGFPLWGKSVITLSILALGSLVVSTRLLRTPARTER
jgi:ABC-type transport system involved in multi-copper enzyme maturation permease subunit